MMLLGSDRRPQEQRRGRAAGARSDTIMLVRLDPDKKATALMSLPRDLKVEIPGHGTDKINAAYELGGPELTLETVKAAHRAADQPRDQRRTSTASGAAVNAIGCVYADIDRRYFNDSRRVRLHQRPARLPALCGREALQYVRFRHEDTDLVRAARQQDFLRQAKQQIAASKLIDNRDQLIEDLRHATRAPTRRCSSRPRCCGCSSWRCSRPTSPIREVQLPRARSAPSYVEATDAQMREMTDEFLGVEDTPGPRGESTPKVKRPKRKHKLRGGRRPRGRHRLRQGPGASRPCSRAPADAARLYPTRAPAGLACSPARRASTSCAAPTASATAPTGW